MPVKETNRFDSSASASAQGGGGLAAPVLSAAPGNSRRKRKFSWREILLYVVVAVLCFYAGCVFFEDRDLQQGIDNGWLVAPENRSACKSYRWLDSWASWIPYYRGRLLRQKEILSLKLKPPAQDTLARYEKYCQREPDKKAWQQASKLLRCACELEPDDKKLKAQLLYCEGRVNYETNVAERRQNKQTILKEHYQESIAKWQEAHHLASDWSLPGSSLGMIYLEIGTGSDLDEAQRILMEARARPNPAYAYEHLSQLFLKRIKPGMSPDEKKKWYTNARDSFAQAANKAPGWPRPHLWLSKISRDLGECDRWLDEWETTKKLLAGCPIELGKQANYLQQKPECRRVESQNPLPLSEEPDR